MSGLTHEIVIKGETRPAMLRVGNAVEGFHEERCLVHTALVGNNLQLVCELEDGHMQEARPEWVRFLDSAERFGEIAWRE